MIDIFFDVGVALGCVVGYMAREIIFNNEHIIRKEVNRRVNIEMGRNRKL